MSTLEKLARQIFDSQPFSGHLGASLESVGTDSAEIALTVTDELTQQHGFAHGGVLSYLADNSMAFAGGLALGGDVLMSEFKINFVRPAVGGRVVARARTTAVSRRQAVCRSKVFAVSDDGGETLCAVAQGTVVAASTEK
ncbi:MAG: PaaI family thioesterase [Gammaproteobacteria bacterium]|nr:PaaI family thioesterase [Gammaproteobacteria bacterium]